MWSCRCGDPPENKDKIQCQMIFQCDVNSYNKMQTMLAIKLTFVHRKGFENRQDCRSNIIAKQIHYTKSKFYLYSEPGETYQENHRHKSSHYSEPESASAGDNL